MHEHTVLLVVLLVSLVLPGQIEAFLAFFPSPLSTHPLHDCRETQTQIQTSFLPNAITRSRSLRLGGNANDDEKSTARDVLLSKASELRKEAEELESKLKREKSLNKESTTKKTEGSTGSNPTISYTKLENSCWTLSYRFASDPPPKEDDDSNERKLMYHSGRVTVRLREDGYTDQILPEKDGVSSSSPTFVKFWGWDTELSREDSETYLSFSSDVILPQNDPNYSNGDTLRFYFNSKVETDSKGIISLCDGTVTIKRDVDSPGGGFWGVFNGGGILAQFRYCGEFLIKPVSGRDGEESIVQNS